MLKNIKGAIFDLDGTLVDSMGMWESIDKNILNARNIPMPKNFKKTIQHMSFYEFAQYLKTTFNLTESIADIQNEWYETCAYEYATNIPLKPGGRELLIQLKEKKIKIALATSNYRELTEISLRKNKIYEFFDAITTVNEVARGKDFPDIYLLTAKKLNLSPKDCVVFEDILPAVKGAKAAGMTVVGVYDFYSDYQWDDIVKHAGMHIFIYYNLLQTI